MTEFVKRQRALTARLQPRLVWNSAGKNIYVKKVHGELK